MKRLTIVVLFGSTLTPLPQIRIETYIRSIHEHLQRIQEQENILRKDFSQKLRDLGAAPPQAGDKKGRKKNEERDIYEEFDSKMKKINEIEIKESEVVIRKNGEKVRNFPLTTNRQVLNAYYEYQSY